jgi:AcrR family transcriptional regulator
MAVPIQDRRVRRTQQSLYSALVRLIVEKGYEAVTVNDILERANVGRSTFYSHHSGKESLLLSGIQRLREDLVRREVADTSGPISPRPPLAFSRALFEHVQHHRALYRALGVEGSSVVLARIRGVLTEVVRADLVLTKRADSTRKISRSATIHAVVDAMISIIQWWVEMNPRLAPSDVDAVFRSLLIPAIDGATLV